MGNKSLLPEVGGGDNEQFMHRILGRKPVLVDAVWRPLCIILTRLLWETVDILPNIIPQQSVTVFLIDE